MNELELVRAAEGALERSRARIDDLNVYPVPDGDTGTNMLLTVRAVRESLEAGNDDIVRAALLGARGNSGVILSQIIRGAVEGYEADRSIATALRRASDTAYAAVREPVEGTILTVVRELADEAERRRDDDPPGAPRRPRHPRRRGCRPDAGATRATAERGRRRRGRRGPRRDRARNRRVPLGRAAP